MDINFVDTSSAPATGTIEPEGFLNTETFQLLLDLKEINIVGLDLVGSAAFIRFEQNHCKFSRLHHL